MSISQNFPDLTPTLNLNFAGSKKLDSRVTFTRGSTGTYMDDNGIIKTAGINQPRFDHSYNGTSVESLGLLVEESRTNLVTYSNDFSNAVWSGYCGDKTSFTYNTTDVLSPDGTNNALKIVRNSVTTCNSSPGEQSRGMLWVGTTIVNTSNTHTCSLYVRGAVGGEVVTFGFNDSQTSNYTLTTSWQRITYTGTPNSTSRGIQIQAIPINTTYYIWGAQVEVGSFATSYIPTVASQVTRSTDNASITGTNFSNWYNPNEWTLFVNQSLSSSVLLSSPAEAQNVFINDGTTNNYYAIRYVTDTTSPYIDGYANTSGVPVIDTAGSSGSTFPNPVKSIFAVKLNDSAFCYNGNTVEVDSTSTLSTSVNRMTIGGSPKTGTISQVSYYPKRLTNSQLQNLTR